MLELLTVVDEVIETIDEENPSEDDVSVVDLGNDDSDEADEAGEVEEADEADWADEADEADEADSVDSAESDNEPNEAKALRATRAVMERFEAERVAQTSYDGAKARIDELRRRVNRVWQTGALPEAEHAKLVSELDGARSTLDTAFKSRPSRSTAVLSELRRVFGAARNESSDRLDTSDVTIYDVEASRRDLSDGPEGPEGPERLDGSGSESSEPSFEVEVMLNRYAKLVDGVETVFYRVKWANYGTKFNDWRPEYDVGRMAIEEYERDNGPLGANHGIAQIEFYRKRKGFRVSIEANKAVPRAELRRVWLQRDEFVDSSIVESFEQTKPSSAARTRLPSASGTVDRRNADDSGSDESADESADEPGGGPGGPGGPGGGGASLARLLTWDANRSQIRISITKTLRDGNFRSDSHALWSGLMEFTVTRLFLLEAATPPSTVLSDNGLLLKVATAYYEIEKVSFLSNFKKTIGGPSEKEHKRNEIAYLTRRAKRRWTELRKACEAERMTLRSYIAALRRIRAETETDAAPTLDVRYDDIQNRIVREHRAGGRWWSGMHKPEARSTTQNNLMRYRTAETRRFLAFVRRQWYPAATRTDAARRRDTFGSPFSGKIPTSAQEPSVTVVDHTTPQLWFENSELVDVFAQAREDIVNTLPVPANENNKKGSSPIRFIAPDPDDPSRPDHTLFFPEADYFSEARHAVCARRILYSFLAYGLITEQHDAHSSLRDQGPGCAYYKHPRVRDHLLRVVHDHPAADHEQFVNLMTLFVFRTWNPLVANPQLFSQGEFASEYRELLQARLEGSTLLPELCGDAMRRAVSGFPI